MSGDADLLVGLTVEQREELARTYLNADERSKYERAYFYGAELKCAYEALAQSRRRAAEIQADRDQTARYLETVNQAFDVERRRAADLEAALLHRCAVEVIDATCEECRHIIRLTDAAPAERGACGHPGPCYVNPDGSHVRGCSEHHGLHPFDWCRRREPTDGESTPFRRVIDDITKNCGCACHFGVGYRSACAHCFGVGGAGAERGATDAHTAACASGRNAACSPYANPCDCKEPTDGR